MTKNRKCREKAADPDAETQAKEEEMQETWRAQLRAMNERFESRLDESSFEGVRDEKIYHGLKIAASTVLYKNFVDLCFCDKTKEYLLLEKSVALHRYSMQGKALQPTHPLDAQLTFSRMIWCNGANCLVCYEPNDERIWILDSNFELLQIVKNEFPCKAVYYVAEVNEIVVVDSHQSIKYPLDEVERDLEPTKAMSYVDPEFGPTWQLDRSALMLLLPKSEQERGGIPAQLAASYMSVLYLMPLERRGGDDEDEDEEGGLVGNNVIYAKRRLNASKAPITAIHCHTSSSWILTGDQQGNVTAWDLNLNLVMSHGGAHADQILWLASHPSICGFLSYSSSSDQGISRLQVWSCNFRDKLETFDEFGRILGFEVVESAAAVVLLTATKLLYLTMHQVYCFFAPLATQVESLFATENPMYQTKIISAGKDNSVRIFSSHGKQLNVQILPEDTFSVVSAVYSGNQNQLFTIILKSGEILVSDASTCPAKFQRVFINDEAEISCVTVYEYFDEIRDEARLPKKPRTFHPIKILLIAGTKEGKLIVIDVNTGKPEANIRAHKGSVIQLRSSVTSQRLISLSVDRCVRVWRVFADLANPLALYYTLNFTVPITRVSTIGLTLCMTNSSEESGIHQLLMEDTKKRLRLEHHNSKDHTAPILDLTSSESLEVCATSSLDNTIRIWDRENCLIKILEINTCARKMTFSSVLGDIVFGAGRHLYRISHENYLSPKYRAKIAAKELSTEIDEESVAEDELYRIYDEVVDREKMLRPVVSTPLASLDITSSDKPRPDVLIRQQICALYEFRDEDIRKIKDNLVEPRKRVANRALMTTDVWEQYVTDLLDSMTRPVPQVPEYDFKGVADKLKKEKRVYNERGVFQMLYGYSIDETEDSENLEELVQDAKLPLHGFLPNSILYKRKQKEPPKIYVSKEPSVKKEPVKYKYPRHIYPDYDEDDDDDARRQSIRLSQLMAGNMGLENAAG